MKNKRGFTLIELLVVVSVIGVLAGAVIRVMNVDIIKYRARDSVRLSTMQKLVTAIETYYAAEGKYPSAAEQASATSVFRTVYLKQWPTEPNSSVYNYFAVGASAAGVYVTKEATTGCFKYYSDWGAIRECTTNCAGNSLCP